MEEDYKLKSRHTVCLLDRIDPPDSEKIGEAREKSEFPFLRPYMGYRKGAQDSDTVAFHCLPAIASSHQQGSLPFLYSLSFPSRSTLLTEPKMPTQECQRQQLQT